MAYTALYRKYRPLQFSDVIGQEHITTILKNQVRTGHIAHAYLFCGSRGTGKTTSAKILARAVNCLSPADGEPCTTCDSCRRYLSEDAVDIIEIDAASNNGVDDVRTLIDNARYTPLNMQRKVYIIDEVHMLTNQAFNALLKTLEEPPAHVVFILATTEPQKLPATIVSRCQRFDFRRLSVQNITATLKNVLDKASASIDEDGLIAIARAAEGGMRDALSLADQCLSFCGDHVTAKDVFDVLGCMQQDFLSEIADALINGNAGEALRRFDGVIASGRDVGVFLQDLIRHYRALLLAHTCGDCADILDCTKEAMAQYKTQAESASEANLLRAMRALIDASSKLKAVASPRLLVESTLVALCRPQEEQSLLALEERVIKLEAALSALQSGTVTLPAAQAAPNAKSNTPSKAASKSSPSEERPPWEDAPASGTFMEAEPLPWADEPIPAPAETAAPVLPKPPKSEASAKAKSDPQEPNSGDANAIWKQLLLEMKKRNQLHIYVPAERAKGARLEDKTFSVLFAPSNAAMATVMKVPSNFKAVEALLQEVNSAYRLAVSVEDQDPALQDLEATFGAHFRVEE